MILMKIKRKLDKTWTKNMFNDKTKDKRHFMI